MCCELHSTLPTMIYFQTTNVASEKKKFAKPTSTCVNIQTQGKQTRASLRRKVQPTMHSHVQHYLAVDGQAVRSVSKRDREVFALEAQLKERIRSEMTAEELEQLDMLEGVERHEKTPRKARK